MANISIPSLTPHETMSDLDEGKQLREIKGRREIKGMSDDTSRKAIITLTCGCFFAGREFFVDPQCEEHDDGDDEDENHASRKD